MQERNNNVKTSKYKARELSNFCCLWKNIYKILSLNKHTKIEHDNEFNESYSDLVVSPKETRFVFSESMLDEFLDKKG